AISDERFTVHSSQLSTRQKSSWNPNLASRPGRLLVGVSQDEPYRELIARIGLALKALYTSNMPWRRRAPSLTIFVTRKSTWLIRPSKSVCGGIRSTVTVPRAPAARFRPRDGTISVLVAT